MKLIAITLIAATAAAPEPIVLDAKAQMELKNYLSGVQQELNRAEQASEYWHQMYKNKKGLCT